MRVYILLLIALLLVIPASAKNDAYVEDLLGDWGGVDAPLTLPMPLDWKAIHGRLGEFGDIDAFTFSFDAPEEDWAVEVRVGVCGEHFAAVYPSIALIGAGLETAEGLELPFELAEGMGAVMVSQSAVEGEARAVDTEFSFYYETANTRVFNSFYEESELIIDIPAAGDYTLAIWEPEGHVGGYFLWTGNQHPENMDYIDFEALEDAFNLINTGAWMGQDCEAPLNAASCPPAVEAVGELPENDFPELSEVGEGFVLTGTVYDAVTCMPLAGAEIDFEIDGLGVGTVHSNQQGAFQLVSNPGTNIHFYISAEGYESSVTEQLLDAAEGEMQFAVSLAAGT